MTDEVNCPLCIDRRGKRWTEALHKGNKSIRDAQLVFNMKKEDIEEHLYKHSSTLLIEEPSSLAESSEREFYISRLAQMGTDLNRMLEDVVCDGNTNPETIRSATTLTKEIRETLKLLGEITKVISNDETAQLERALLDMRTNYLTLTNIITAQACPECQKKILAAIDMQKQLLGKK